MQAAVDAAKFTMLAMTEATEIGKESIQTLEMPQQEKHEEAEWQDPVSNNQYSTGKPRTNTL